MANHLDQVELLKSAYWHIARAFEHLGAARMAVGDDTLDDEPDPQAEDIEPLLPAGPRLPNPEGERARRKRTARF
jgi:hypothetical protein